MENPVGTVTIRVSCQMQVAELQTAEILIPGVSSYDRVNETTSKIVSALSDIGFGLHVSRQPRQIEVRKGQIALAVLKLKVLRDGIKLNPNDLRSEMGNAVKELNELDPTLNITLDEALKLYREFVELASEAAFRPKNSARTGLRPIGDSKRRALEQKDLNNPNLDVNQGHQRYDK